MPDALDALKQLVASEGWQEFSRYARSQWSDAFVLDRISRAVSGTVAGDELTQHESARNLLAAREAVMQMLAWPEQEIERLGKNQTPTGKQTPVQRFMAAVGR